MKNFFKYLSIVNLIWAIIFFCFQTCSILTFQFDGRWNDPMTREEYIEKGGNAFDYYAGYAWFSSSDSRNYYDDSKFDMELRGRTFIRYFYIFVYFLLWMIGMLTLRSIAAYFNPTHWIAASLDEHDGEEDKREPWPKPTVSYYAFAFLSTCISLYGVYYTYIYATKFWHQ